MTDPVREAVIDGYRRWCRKHGYEAEDFDAEDDGLVDSILGRVYGGLEDVLGFFRGVIEKASRRCKQCHGTGWDRTPGRGKLRACGECLFLRAALASPVWEMNRDAELKKPQPPREGHDQGGTQ